MQILVCEKKSFEKARGNAERKEEMKERGHTSLKGPAGMRAQLSKLVMGIRIRIMDW